MAIHEMILIRLSPNLQAFCNFWALILVPVIDNSVRPIFNVTSFVRGVLRVEESRLPTLHPKLFVYDLTVQFKLSHSVNGAEELGIPSALPG